MCTGWTTPRANQYQRECAKPKRNRAASKGVFLEPENRASVLLMYKGSGGLLVLMISRHLSVTGDSATEVKVGLLSSAIRQCLLGGTATPSVEEGKMKFCGNSLG